MHQLCCMKKVANSVCKMHDFCLKIEEFLLFLTCCFKLTTTHESKFASTCKMCFPNTCKTVLCSGNQFPVKIHIFLFFNFVPFFMELPYPCCVPYPKRFYAEVIVTVFKTSQLCAVVRCCAQVLVEHCTEFRTSFISN